MKTHTTSAAVLTVSSLFGLGASAAFAHDATYLPEKSILSAPITQISPVVPKMGEHWADPSELPLGPIYCVHEGKVICLEFMIAQDDFETGKSWPVLSGLEGLPPVNHTSIVFEPHGHEGFEVPHYDIHMFFISPEEVAAIK